MSATTRNYARAMSIFALCSRLAFADGDVPRVVELTPAAHEARVEALTCQKDLADCNSGCTKWIIIGTAAGAVSAAIIAFAAGYAAGKK